MRNWKLVGAWAVCVGVLAEGMPWLVENYAATDNVRELFRTDHRHLLSSYTWFLLLCLSVPATAAIAARRVLRRQVFGPLCLIAIAPLAGWFCLRFAVTVESIHDILGTPMLGWPYDLESILRFAAVFVGLWVMVVVGILPIMADYPGTTGKAIPTR